jgi:hypothetical protein
MIKVSYVKFYQAVQVGKHLESFLGGNLSKAKGAELSYEHGLLKIEGKEFQTVYVPFSNIMYFHEKPAEKKAK